MAGGEQTRGEMSHIVDSLKQFGQAGRRLAPPSPYTAALWGKAKGEVSWQLVLTLALLLSSSLLVWWLSPWRSGTGKTSGHQYASSSQPNQIAKETIPKASDVLAAFGVKKNESATAEPHESEIEPAYLQRQRAILEASPQLVTRPSGAEEDGHTPANAPRSQSPARSIAVADVVARIPSSYINREIPWDAAALPVRISDSSKSPATVGESRRNPDGTPESLPDKPPASREPVEFKELPTQIQDALSMSISMFVYSKNADERRMTINGSKVREGQEVSPGLRLESIVQDGGIFSYQGYRFHKAARAD